MLSVGGLMEQIVEQRHCGTRYRNGNELAEQILGFYCDRTMLATYARNARALYEERFCADRINERFADYLKELIEKGTKK